MPLTLSTTHLMKRLVKSFRITKLYKLLFTLSLFSYLQQQCHRIWNCFCCYTLNLVHHVMCHRVLAYTYAAIRRCLSGSIWALFPHSAGQNFQGEERHKNCCEEGISKLFFLWFVILLFISLSVNWIRALVKR